MSENADPIPVFPARAHPFPDDHLLRLHGFAIALRPRDRGPIWVRQGIRYTQEAALAIVRDENQKLHDLLRASAAEG